MRNSAVETDPEVDRVLEAAFGDGNLPIGERVGALAAWRQRSPGAAAILDERVVARCAGVERALREVQDIQARLRDAVTSLTLPPWHPAVFLGPADLPSGHRALVMTEIGRRVVSAGPAIEVERLQVGEEVLLGADQNTIVARAPYRSRGTGETALFVRYAGDGRLVLQQHDEELVVSAAGWLGDSLKPGDRLRWDRSAWLATERIAQGESLESLVEETPAETFAAIGGLDDQIGQLTRVMTLRLEHRDTAARYGLTLPAGAILAGPPGTGKTLLARAFGNWLASRTPSGRSRFIEVKPSQMLSKWFGESEARVRRTFDRARRAAEDEPGVPVLLFFDEVDSLAASRGEGGQRYNDQVLTAFLAELNGTATDGGVFVIAATNRLDALDAAVTRPGGRLGDCIIQVPRPARAAGREILRRHLPASLAFDTSATGGCARTAREQVVDAAVSAVYAPNGTGALAHVTLRDGSRRTITPADLVSGAVLASMARTACERACRRAVDLGEEGIRAEDARRAAIRQFAVLAAALTPRNIRTHLETLPQDLDAVRVEPVTRRVADDAYLTPRSPSWA
jgi:proteasome-associated ATPase